MNKRPWMPFYGMEYLADTAHLSPAESGAYIHLIIYYWFNGGLPDDDYAVARITRLNPTAWAKSIPRLKTLFKGGHWKHPRIERELAQAIEISNRNRAKAMLRHSHGNATAHTLTHTHTKKDYVNGFEGNKKEEIREGFKAKPGSKEFEAWKVHYEKISNEAMLRELSGRELEGRSYDFPCQWPPEH